MELKVGDVVEFKKYEDIDVDERVMITKDFFPSYGKVKEINVNGLDEFFRIVGSQLIFSKESVARVIDDADVNDLNEGDEVLVKVTVKQVIGDHIWVSLISKNDVVEVLERKEPERFIVQENHYGMYIGASLELVSDKIKAQGYASRDAAYQEASEMHLNAYEVIPYDN